MRHEFYNLDKWTNRFLPHYNANGKYQFINYRLADSLPQELLKNENTSYHLIENYLDNGYGSCLLKDSKNANLVIDTWKHFHGERYELIAFVVMPNHVHLLIKILNDWPLDKILYSWKSYTAKEIIKNEKQKDPRCNLKRVWSREYYDRFIRDGNHYINCIEYILRNPQKAGLVKGDKVWPFVEYNKGFISDGEF